MPFYQSALGDRLEHELTCYEYIRVIMAAADEKGSYANDNICLEFTMVTQPELARRIRNQYTSRLAILYDRVLQHRIITANKSDSLWNVHINIPAQACGAT